MKSTSVTLLLLTVLAVACKSTSLEGAGFLDDYAQLEKVKDRKGSYSWFKPGIDLRHYSFLQIDPVIVCAIPGCATDMLPADLKQRATDGFQKVLFETIDPYYTVVPNKGANVLRLRLALTDLTPDEGEGSEGSAAIEGELIDSVSGEVLAKFISRVSGSSKGYRAEQQWRAVEGAFIEWAERLLDYMDSFHETE